MKLQDGKLYETADGRRFRVTFDTFYEYFTCSKSFEGCWDQEGQANNTSKDNLTREIKETRWVPVHKFYISDNPDDENIYRVFRGHLQKQVPRSTLVKLKEKEPEIDLPKAGTVETAFGNFTWVAEKNKKGQVVFDIETFSQLKRVKA